MGGLGLGALTLSAQEPGATFSSDVRVVQVLANVRDKKGKVVTALGQDDFIVNEDGRTQQIRYFSHETDLPLTLGLLVDTSLSQRRLLNDEKSASFRFLDKVLRAGKDKTFVLHFDFEAELLQDLTDSRVALQKALDQLQTPPMPEGAGRGNGGGRSGGGNGGGFPGVGFPGGMGGRGRRGGNGGGRVGRGCGFGAGGRRTPEGNTARNGGLGGLGHGGGCSRPQNPEETNSQADRAAPGGSWSVGTGLVSERSILVHHVESLPAGPGMPDRTISSVHCAALRCLIVVHVVLKSKTVLLGRRSVTRAEATRTGGPGGWGGKSRSSCGSQVGRQTVWWGRVNPGQV